MRHLEGLNPSQRAAAEAVRGPVCILAGAGSGKTTTITRRIAHQIACGAFAPDEILAITFTDRAANEMRSRLRALGTPDVRARTFHAEALAQVAHFTEAPELMPSKGQLVYDLVRRLPRPYRFKPTKDVAGEIEWAKNRRIPPDRYREAVGDRPAPLPPDLMVRVYGTYEARKRAANKLDFEDLLAAAIDLIAERPDVAERVRARYRALTVDEYQDVNLLQQALLDAWLGGRDEVCVVGDDYQSIYGFTGASPHYLTGFAERHPGAQVFTLTESYRSTPQVLEAANRLVPGLGGSEKALRCTLPSGPEPAVREFATGEAETAAVVEGVRGLHAEGVALEEIAVLYRINARSEDYQEALSVAGIPFQVRDGAFLRRPGPRSVLRALRRSPGSAPAPEAVEAAARSVGWDPDFDEDASDEEATRQADLTRLVRLAEETGGDVAAFVTDLQGRFSRDEGGRGVVLSTYHRAKGLEWDAVLLPRLEERELPFARAKADDDVAEERRLLYVGITRARRRLWLSWARERDGKRVRPSRFVREIAPEKGRRAVRPSGPKVAPDENGSVDPELFGRLRRWRKEAADAAEVPAYVVFHDATLRAICDLRPSTLEDLARVSGVGPTKLERYGPDVLEVVAGTGVS